MHFTLYGEDGLGLFVLYAGSIWMILASILESVKIGEVVYWVSMFRAG